MDHNALQYKENPDGSVFIAVLDAPARKTSEPVQKKSGIELTTNILKYKSWGSDNNFPKLVMDIVAKSSIIPSTLEALVNIVSSGGLVYGVIAGKNPDGSNIYEPVDHNEIEDFIVANDLQDYLEESLTNLYYWWTSFTDLILNQSRSRIVRVSAIDTVHTRYELQNERTGIKERIYINADYPTKETTNTRVMPLVDNYDNPIAQIANGTAFRYAYPISRFTPGKVYYPSPPWHAALINCWADFANSVAEFKQNILKNQLACSYIIHIPEKYWQWRFPDWEQQKDKRIERMKFVRDEIENTISGAENAGKTIIATYAVDSYGKDYTKWTIEPVENKLMNGAYIEDSQEAASHLLYALGFDGTLIGATPGKGMGAGSGSDKRVAYNYAVIRNKPYQDKVLKPLNFISQYNKWKDKQGRPIVWWINNQYITTLDHGQEVKQKQA